MEGCKASSLDEVMDAVTRAEIRLDYGPFLDMSPEVRRRSTPWYYACTPCTSLGGSVWLPHCFGPQSSANSDTRSNQHCTAAQQCMV